MASNTTKLDLKKIDIWNVEELYLFSLTLYCNLSVSLHDKVKVKFHHDFLLVVEES